MMVFKKLLLTAVVGLFATSFMVLAGSQGVMAKTYKLKFSHPYSPMHPQQRFVIAPWIEKIEAASKGQIKIKIYPGGALGKPGQTIAAVKKGLVDFGWDIQDYSPGVFPVTTVFELPFMTGNAEKSSGQMWKAYEQIPDLNKEYKDVHLLWINCHTPGFFNTVKKPIKTLDDIKGMKIRTASSFVTEALEALGAVPVTLPITETYTSLERGLVDGTVLTYDGITVFKLDEQLKYATRTDFYTMTFWAAMNKKKYNALPKNLQKVIDENSGEIMSQKAGSIFDSDNEKSRQKWFKEGLKEFHLPKADMEKMRETVLPLKAKWVKDMTAKGFDGQGILDTATKLLAE